MIVIPEPGGATGSGAPENPGGSSTARPLPGAGDLGKTTEDAVSSLYLEQFHQQYAGSDEIIVLEPGLLSEEKLGPLVVVVLLILTGLVVFLIKCYCDTEIDSATVTSATATGADSRSSNNARRNRQQRASLSASNNAEFLSPPPSYEEAVNMPRVSDLVLANKEIGSGYCSRPSQCQLYI